MSKLPKIPTKKIKALTRKHLLTVATFKESWPLFRALLRSFYLAVRQPPKKGNLGNGARSPYLQGRMDESAELLEAIETASQIWFEEMDKLN